MKLVFATNNEHKVKEISHVLGNSFELLILSDVGITEDIPENEATLAEIMRSEPSQRIRQKVAELLADN